MAGNDEEAKIFILLFMTVLSHLFLIKRRRTSFQRLQLLAIRRRRRRLEAFLLWRIHSQRRNYRRKSAWVLERPQFWFEHTVLNQYENNIWREHFRVSRQTFHFLCNLVGPHLGRQNTNMRQAIPVEKRVAVALWRLATGNSYRTTGFTFGVGRCTALKLKDEFCSALLRNSKEFIKFPKGEAETRSAIQAFQKISCFPQVVGAIDGTHIPIIAPTEHANDYYNGKRYPSVILQGVADAQGRFIHVSTGYAGRIHNTSVLRMSSIVDEVEDGKILFSPVLRTGNGDEIKPLLVADPAYKLTTWCMKPYPETAAITQSERDFNKALSSARVVIEQAFGKLKGRWRCLLDKLDESIDKIPQTIITCCILHNICLSNHDDITCIVDPDNDRPKHLLPLSSHPPLFGHPPVPGNPPVPGLPLVPGHSPLPGHPALSSHPPLPGHLPFPGLPLVPGLPPLPGNSPLPGHTPVPGHPPVPGLPLVPGLPSIPGHPPVPDHDVTSEGTRIRNKIKEAFF